MIPHQNWLYIFTIYNIEFFHSIEKYLWAPKPALKKVNILINYRKKKKKINTIFFHRKPKS